MPGARLLAQTVPGGYVYLCSTMSVFCRTGLV